MKKTIILLLCLITALTFSVGCVQSDVSAQPSENQYLNAPPEDVRNELQQIIDSGLEETGIPGMQIEISSPQWTWNSAAGNASAISGEKAEPGMRFIIASVSKSFTSVAVQKLSESGKLSLDDKISSWLPAELVETIPNGEIITIRQLLDHTSGIADYDEDSIILMEYNEPDKPVSYQFSLEQGIKESPLYPPGTGYTYSNVNYILLTLIVDNAAGIPYADYLQREILIPAGLNDTFLQQTNQIPGSHMKAALLGEDGSIMDCTNLYVLFDRGAGDIISTASDLNRFHRALRSGEIIDLDTLAIMEEPSTQSGDYGLGYATNQLKSLNMTIMGHNGGYPGSITYWYYIPEKDTYIALNLNSMDVSMEKPDNVLKSVLLYIENIN